MCNGSRNGRTDRRMGQHVPFYPRVGAANTNPTTHRSPAQYTGRTFGGRPLQERGGFASPYTSNMTTPNTNPRLQTRTKTLDAGTTRRIIVDEDAAYDNNGLESHEIPASVVFITDENGNVIAEGQLAVVEGPVTFGSVRNSDGELEAVISTSGRITLDIVEERPLREGEPTGRTTRGGFPIVAGPAVAADQGEANPNQGGFSNDPNQASAPRTTRGGYPIVNGDQA